MICQCCNQRIEAGDEHTMQEMVICSWCHDHCDEHHTPEPEYDPQEATR